MSKISKNIERLRNLQAETTKVPTLDQLKLIVDDVFRIHPLNVTLQRPELEGFTAEDICAIVEDYGKFRARSAKGETKALTMHLDEFLEVSGMLFPPDRHMMLDWNQRNARIARTGVHATKWAGEVMPECLLTDPPPVVIPEGYTPHDLGRNIRASLAAMVKNVPSDTSVERYYNRRYAEAADELTAEHLHLVWWLASIQLGYKLDELDGTTDMLNRMLVAAHDMLETAIADTRQALSKLAAPAAWQLELAELKAIISECDWTHPGLFSRINPVIEMLEAEDNERGRNLLRTRLGSLRSWWDNEASGLCDIGQLNEAHLRMLVERSGLAYDAAAEKEIRGEVRNRLIELGFTADLDQEVPAGVTAWRQGKLAEFYASREARAAGDSGWATLYALGSESNDDDLVDV